MYSRGHAVRAAPAVLLAALLALPLPLLSEPAPQPRALSVWFESATVKVKPADPALASTAVWDGNTIRLSAARGEHEAFQTVFTVTGDSTAAVSLSPVEGPVTLPDASIEFYLVGAPKLANTDWPDPLVRCPNPVSMTVDYTGTSNNIILVDIFIPTDAPAGRYYANLTVDHSGGRVVTPLALTVWDITIPERNTLMTWFDDSPSAWASWYGCQPWSYEHMMLMKNVYAQYKKFRISPGNIALGQVGRYNMSVNAGVVSVDFSGTDPWLSYCLDELNFTSFRFPLTGYSPRREDMDASTGHPDSIYFWGAPPYDMNPLYADHIGQYIRLVAEHYRQKGWLDKAHVYATDEPIAFNDDVTSYWQHPDYHVVRQFYDLTKANAPDLKFANTVQLVPELYNYTDVWAVPGGYYHELDARERIAAGQSVWWYNVDAGIESDGVKGRALYWDTFSRGVQGVLYWGTNFWDYDTVNNDPWQGSNSNGDGYLFYPATRFGLEDDVCPSLRLFLARDGLEDFELLNLYGEKYGYEAARAVAESVAVGSSFAGARYRPVDDLTLYQLRGWLANQITRQTADLAWSDTFLEWSNVSSATDLVPDPAWEGSWALAQANPPFLVDNLDAIGGWRPNNQPHIFSSVAIDNTISTEGTGSLRVDFWRDDDPGEPGGYEHMRNGRVITDSLALTDWSGFDILEMDVRSVDHPPGNLYMLVGDAQGAVVSSSLHRYARYTGGPSEDWTHFVIDISGRSRSSIKYIEPIVYNYFLEVPYKHYSYWIDNITVRKVGYRPSGTLTSRPIDLGSHSDFDSIEYIAQWNLPGASLGFETRSSGDSANWSAWAPASPSGSFRADITSPAGRFIQYRADLGPSGAIPPVLSEVRVVYRPVTDTDLFVVNITFDPPVPNDNETFKVSVTAGNNGPAGVAGALVELYSPSGLIARRLLDLATGERAPINARLSLPASAAGWPVSALIGFPVAGWNDTVEENNEVTRRVVVNDFPAVSIDAPASALVGDEVRFDGSGSRDDQGISQYRWSFPDDRFDGPAVNRSFLAAGTYPYSLDVTDTYGAGSRLEGAIEVFNHTPVPSFVVSPENGSVRTNFTFISTAFDPEGTVVGTTWLFGDGMAGFGRVVSHAFPDDRQYTVNCTIEFFENGSLRRATASRLLSIENLPPTARFSATNDTAGKRKLLGFDASASTDPDDALAEEGFRWTFGDGTCATGRMASRSYARAGAYNVTLTVTDDDGATSTFVLPVRITNQPPVPDFQLPVNVTCNRTFTLDASRSRDPDGALVSFRWEFDDGTSATGPAATHAFSLPGLRSVTLVVTDDDGAAVRLTRNVRADPEPAPARPPGPASPTVAGLQPAVWAAAAIIAFLGALFLATRARPRLRESSRWTRARHATGPGAPARAEGPPPRVRLIAPMRLEASPDGQAPAEDAATAAISAPHAPVAPAAPAAAPPPAHSRPPPRVVRAIPPPPPRLVRELPPAPDAAVIDLESARPAKVIELAEPMAAPGRAEALPLPRKEPVEPLKPEAESDPTLPSNPWAENKR
jgi:PKD repeat protein